MSYRDPPPVLPSLRSVQRYDAFDHLPADIPDAVVDVIIGISDADHREKMARQRARKAPCPAFVVGPPVFRLRPPATPLPGPGQRVSE